MKPAPSSIFTEPTPAVANTDAHPLAFGSSLPLLAREAGAGRLLALPFQRRIRQRSDPPTPWRVGRNPVTSASSCDDRSSLGIVNSACVGQPSF